MDMTKTTDNIIISHLAPINVKQRKDNLFVESTDYNTNN